MPFTLAYSIKMLAAMLAVGMLLGAIDTDARAEQNPEFRCQPGETYYMNVMVTGVEYWFPVYEMFKQAAQQLGCRTVYGGTPAYDVNQQIASFEQMLARRPAGILLHPMNPDPFIEPIDRAAAAGVPVVTFAADSPNSQRVAHITSDNFREGEAAADLIGEALGGRGRFAVLENPGQDNHDRRVAAFIARMQSRYPETQLVARAATGQDPARAYQAVLAMVQANPELAAIFMPEASSAIGAAQAVSESGKQIKIVSVDVNARVLDMLKSGEMFGAINPNQGVQGYFGFIALFLAAHPELIDPMNDYRRSGRNPAAFPLLDNGYAIVDAGNSDDFRWESYLERRGTRGINE